MSQAPANLFDLRAVDATAEQFAALVETGNLKIERIVSHGQASPAGFWYDQPWAEWVVVLSGAAGLRFDDAADITVLRAGDHVLIPARTKHRVEWTEKGCGTIWLAVHYREAG